MIFLIGFGAIALALFAWFAILLCYEMWKDSELRKDILAKKKRKGC